MEERMKTIEDFLGLMKERNQRIETLLQQLQPNQINNRINEEPENREDLQEKEAVKSVDQVFDKMREPNTSLNQALDKDTQSSVRDLQATFVIAVSTPAPIAAEIQVEDDDFEEDVHSTHKVHVEQEVGLENKHQMFSKLRALDSPYFCNIMALGAEQERFCKLRGVLHMAAKFLLPDEHYDGNSTLKCPYIQVKTDSLMVLYALPPMNLAEHVVLPLLLGDKDWFMGSSLSRILGLQANNTRVFESVVNRKTFLTFKELYSWGIHSSYCHWAGLELPSGAENFLARLGRAYNSSDYLTSCIFIYDPGDLLFSATSSGLGFCLRYNSRAYMIVDPFGDLHTFDSRGNVKSFCGRKLWQIGKLQLLLLSDSMLCSIIALSDLVNDKIHAFISLPKWNTWPLLSTLEDKGVFRGKEDPNGKCTWKLFNHLGLWSKYNAIRTNICFVLLSYIFDTGGCVGRISMVVLDDWFVKLLLFSFKSISRYSMIVFDSIPALEVNDGSMGDKAAAYFLLYDTIMPDLEIIINQGFDTVCYKGDFEEAGNDMGLLLWLGMSSLIYVRNHLASNSNILMTMTCNSLCFHPGQAALEKASICLLSCGPTGSETLKNLVLGGMGSITVVDGTKVEVGDLGNNFMVDEASLGESKANCVCAFWQELNDAVKASTCVWIFDPGGNGILSGSTSVMSTSHLVYVIGTNSDGVMYLMFFSNHKNDLFRSGAAGYVRRLYRVHHDDFASVNSEKMSKSPLASFLYQTLI